MPPTFALPDFLHTAIQPGHALLYTDNVLNLDVVRGLLSYDKYSKIAQLSYRVTAGGERGLHQAALMELAMSAGEAMQDHFAQWYSSYRALYADSNTAMEYWMHESPHKEQWRKAFFAFCARKPVLSPQDRWVALADIQELGDAQKTQEWFLRFFWKNSLTR